MMPWHELTDQQKADVAMAMPMRLGEFLKSDEVGYIWDGLRLWIEDRDYDMQKAAAIMDGIMNQPVEK